jgi:hypothetical protein
MSKAENLEQIKRISTFKVSPTARYVASIASIANTLSVSTLMELTGLPRSTIYRALSDVNDAVAEGCGSLIILSSLTDGNVTQEIRLTHETVTEIPVQNPTTEQPQPHIEERAPLTENPSGLSSTSEKIDPPLTPQSPIQARSWEDDVAAHAVKVETGIQFDPDTRACTLVNGTRAKWLARFGDDAEDLQLAIEDAAGIVQINSSTPVSAQIERRLSIIVRDRREKDKRYAAAVDKNNRTRGSAPSDRSKWARVVR